MFSPGLTSVLENTGPFAGNKFTTMDAHQRSEYIRNAKIFILGAGGLGCELLKCLAFNGFKHIDITDMDKVEYSNLNRQFLFRKSDAEQGRYKSQAAAEFIANRVRGRFSEEIEINYHTCKIQELSDDFYKDFDLVIGGLDNNDARVWMSNELNKIAKLYGKIIPMIDGATDSWDGTVRVIYPTQTACMECLRNAFPESKLSYQACTLVSKPRKPEHCVFYAFQIAWLEEKTNLEFYGKDFDVDNDAHISWATKIALQHAKNFNLNFPIDDKFSRKVIKSTVAAIASTQAYVASMCCTEAIKVLTNCAPFLNNKVGQDSKLNIMERIAGNSNVSGIMFQIDYMAKSCQNCLKADQEPRIKISKDDTVADLVKKIEEIKIVPNFDTIINDTKFIMAPHFKDPKKNFAKKLSELNMERGIQLIVSSSNGVSKTILLE